MHIIAGLTAKPMDEVYSTDSTNKERPQSLDSGYSGSGSNPERLANFHMDDPNSKEEHEVGVNMGKNCREDFQPAILVNGSSSAQRGISAKWDSQTKDDLSLSPSSQDSSEAHSNGLTGIILPERFTRNKIRRFTNSERPCLQSHACLPQTDHFFSDSNFTSNPICLKENPQEVVGQIKDPVDTSDSVESREKDLATAILWLRQEIGKMKQQDKDLVRQFLELRAMIHGLRSNGVQQSALNISSASAVDLSTFKGSPSLSRLDEHTDGHKSGSLLRGDDCEVEFRARTVSMVPPRPRRDYNILQVKTFSKEFI